MASFLQSTFAAGVLRAAVAQTAVLLLPTPVSAEPLPRLPLVERRGVEGRESASKTYVGDAVIADYRMEPEALDRQRVSQMVAHANAYRSIIQKVVDARSLPPNWDNDGGYPPSQRTVTNALEFLDTVFSIAPPPRLFVVGDGEIGLAWERGELFAQVSFHDDGVTIVGDGGAEGARPRLNLDGLADGLPPELQNILVEI